jgi:hypothetical protein
MVIDYMDTCQGILSKVPNIMYNEMLDVECSRVLQPLRGSRSALSIYYSVPIHLLLTQESGHHPFPRKQV